MNLLQIRKRFRDLSGRYDLMTSDSTDTIDFMINAGSRFLDRLSEHQKTYATHYKFLSQGSWNLQFPSCRAVKEVWIASMEERWQLEKRDLQDLLAGLMTELVSNIDQGDPLYYSPLMTRTVGTPPTGIESYIDTITSMGNIYNAILILPPPDKQLLVEIKGFYYSDELIQDTDENYWSKVHPNLLLKSSLHELEIFNQNQSKVEAWEKNIQLELDGVNKDLVEESIAEVDQMEG
jgi:hypothetical protein